MKLTGTTKKLYFHTTPNNLEGAKEPFNGIANQRATVSYAEFAERIAARWPEFDATRLKAFVSILGEAIRDYIAEGYRVNLNNWIAVEPGISGSVAAIDAPLTAENKLVPQFTSYVNNLLDDAMPINTASGADIIKIDRVEDTSTHIVNVIKGVNVFVLTGANLHATGEGESLTIVAPGGAKYTAQIVTEGVDSGTGERIYARLAQAIPAGRYNLELVSRGGVADGALQTVAKKNVVVI